MKESNSISSDQNKPSKIHVKFKQKGKASTNYKWCFIITFITLALSFVMNIVSNIMTNSLSLGGAIMILVLIVLVGIGFDILGTAVISSDMIVFTSMAASRVKGAKEAIYLVKNANVFSNIFNDVIGDTCGIISGATIGAIFIKVAISNESIWYVLVGSVVAAVTVGGKALGKGIGIKYSSALVYTIGRIMSIFNYKSYKKK